MKKNILSLIALSIFAFMFWASSTPEKLTKTISSYEEVTKKETETVTLSYEIPVITPSAETKQTQTKGGVTITCEVIPYELTIKDEISQNPFFADPNMRGYDIFEVSHTPKPMVSPDDFELNIKIKNNQERILKVRETALLLQIDGITVHIPEASLVDWYAGMIIKNGEFNYKIKVPEYKNLLNAKLVYLFINDVPTIMDEGGNIKKRENFEWFFECKKKTERREGKKTYTYEPRLIESKQCNKCEGTGTDPQAYKCSSCNGNGVTKNIFDGKMYKCSTCDGTKIVHYKCPDCSGEGTLRFPKSHLPGIASSVTWTGNPVLVKTIPAGAAVQVIDTQTGKYRSCYKSSPVAVDWYCTYGMSCPILVDFQGKTVKVLPYSSDGKEVREIIIDFTKGTPAVTKGTKVE